MSCHCLFISLETVIIYIVIVLTETFFSVYSPHSGFAFLIFKILEFNDFIFWLHFFIQLYLWLQKLDLKAFLNH